MFRTSPGVAGNVQFQQEYSTDNAGLLRAKTNKSRSWSVGSSADLGAGNFVHVDVNVGNNYGDEKNEVFEEDGNTQEEDNQKNNLIVISKETDLLI